MKYVIAVLVLVVINKRAKFISTAIKEKNRRKIILESLFLILLLCFAYLLYLFSSKIWKNRLYFYCFSFFFFTIELRTLETAVNTC